VGALSSLEVVGVALAAILVVLCRATRQPRLGRIGKFFSM
jgi:hypothetical protein